MLSLWVKLVGAFTAISLVGLSVMWLLASQTTASAFRLYVTQGGQQSAARLAPLTADYYARNGRWDGVDAVLQAAGGQAMSDMMGGGSGSDHAMPGWTGWTMLNLRVILLDAQNRVVADSTSSWLGRSLSASEAQSGQPIAVNGLHAGTLLVVSLDTPVSNSPAGEFLDALNRSLLLAGLAAGAIALALGVILSRQITAPLQLLSVAAARIARGDLVARVPVRTRDEVGKVSGAFNTMADSLAQSQTARRNLVADIAHELRTPLAVMRANLEAIQDGVLPLDAEQVGEIQQQAVLLTRLVDDLRLLSLAEAGQLQLECAPADPLALARAVVERNQVSAQAKGVGLTLDSPGALPPVNMDAGRITQVLQNLIANALQYTLAGGQVTVNLRLADNGLTVSVTDTGPGIAGEDLPYVFDRFYRADKSRARASGGSGLGLAIVKQLVEAHHGRIRVESEPGYGACFAFTLPQHL